MSSSTIQRRHCQHNQSTQVRRPAPSTKSDATQPALENKQDVPPASRPKDEFRSSSKTDSWANQMEQLRKMAGVKAGATAQLKAKPGQSLVSATAKAGATPEPTPKENLAAQVDRNFSKWDNGDGFLTKVEVEKALENQNIAPEEKAALETLRGRQKQIQNFSKDEYPVERSGMTQKDIQQFQNGGGQDAKLAEEQYKIEFGLASESKELGEKARQNPNQPASLETLKGSRDYYIERYKDFRRRNPEAEAPDYYLNYGVKYLDRFGELKPNLSPQGQEWLDKTRVNLQQHMQDKIAQDPAAFAEMERNPEAFKNFAYATHPQSYLDAGLRNVPYADRIRIGLTPDGSDLLTKDGVYQAVETGVTLVAQDIVDGAQKNTKYINPVLA